MRKIEPKSMTKSERMHWSFGVDAIRKMEYDLMGYLHEFEALPREWDEIWKDDDRRDPKRTRVTIRLDADVVKFFKGLGPGYQVRLNRVLRAYMHFRLAKLVEGPDTTDYVLKPDKVLDEVRTRPEWGDTMAQVAGLVRANDEADRKMAERTARQEKAKNKDRPWEVEGDPFGGPKGRF